MRDSRVHLENGTLTITKARKDDRGYYKCVVQNEGGTIRSETMLKVYGEYKVSVLEVGSNCLVVAV